MADFILIDGDQVIFVPIFGNAIVAVKPGRLKGSSKHKISGKKIAIEGDEKKVSVPGCVYIAPPYVIPGTGTLKIESLAGDQKAKETKSKGKAVLLKGKQFKAKFEVQNFAKQPPPGPGSPIPDSTKQYSGQGMFVTTNIKTMGT